MVDPLHIQRIGPLAGSNRADARKDVAPRRQDSGAARPSVRSSLPQLVNLATALARQGPPVDHARIAQIKAAIANGYYEVDVNRIAAAILTTGSAEAK
jgi:negative regulator of flagellin synthesis FlgM